MKSSTTAAGRAAGAVSAGDGGGSPSSDAAKRELGADVGAGREGSVGAAGSPSASVTGERAQATRSKRIGLTRNA